MEVPTSARVFKSLGPDLFLFQLVFPKLQEAPAVLNSQVPASLVGDDQHIADTDGAITLPGIPTGLRWPVGIA